MYLSGDYLLRLLEGYLFSIVVEGAVLLLLLSRRHSIGRRIFAGIWLTACTYPIVWMAVPAAIWPVPIDHPVYLAIAETFVPLAEFALFYLAFDRGCGGGVIRDFLAIALANVASFGLGELIKLA